MTRMVGYAGFDAPDEVLEDASLTPGEKRATLKHWLAAVTRRARSAPQAERAEFESLTVELAAAIEAIEITMPARHMAGRHLDGRQGAR